MTVLRRPLLSYIQTWRLLFRRRQIVPFWTHLQKREGRSLGISIPVHDHDAGAKPQDVPSMRDGGELDRFVEMKAREAHLMYQQILREGPQPPTLPLEREAAEQVKAVMFQFSTE
jgi:hypothetical protein